MLPKKGKILSVLPALVLCSACAADGPGLLSQTRTYELGQEPSVSDFTSRNGRFKDSFEKIGNYRTAIVDDGGKEYEVNVIIRDTTAPEWKYFEEEVITEQGKKPSYHFEAEDAGDVSLSIDDENLDIDVPGDYECSVTAADEAGNESTRKFTVRVIEKKQMPPTVYSHVSDSVQKDLAGRIVDILNSSSENQNIVVEEALPEADWNSIHHVDYAVCDSMGWEYMDVTDGYANTDDTYQISINPAAIKRKSKARNIADERLKNISAKAGIKNSDSIKTKGEKIKNLILDRLTYTSEDIYPSMAVQVRKGNSMTYAMLFDQLAEYNGIPSDFITGYVGDDYHCWNRIWIDGKPRWIDLTLEEASPGNYFLSPELWSSHSLSLTEIPSGN